ncbi:MAG: hypothetical protein ACLFM4_13735 [Phormidium sp.]|nr:MAG: Protein of unknown function (DUF2281) [Phormidium sp. OSCR]
MMPILNITPEQVLSLLEQLSWQEQQEILQYLSQKMKDNQDNSDSQTKTHPLNQLAGKIKAFQGMNGLAWQEKIRQEWDED